MFYLERRKIHEGYADHKNKTKFLTVPPAAITIAAQFMIFARGGAAEQHPARDKKSSSDLAIAEANARVDRSVREISAGCHRAERSAKAVIKTQWLARYRGVPEVSYEFQRPAARPRLFTFISRKHLPR